MARNRYLQHLTLLLGLAGLWLALSGHYTVLLLGMGALCVLFTMWLAIRMQVQDHEMYPHQLSLVACLLYVPWLAREIAVSALDVSRRVLSRDMPLSPTVVVLDTSQDTDLGRTIYANSITLTPGTVSIDLVPGKVEVHALSREGAESLASGEMDRRVRALERRS